MKIINNGNEELYISEYPCGTYIATRRQALEQGRRAHPELDDEKLLAEYRAIHWAWVLNHGETLELTEPEEPQS